MIAKIKYKHCGKDMILVTGLEDFEELSNMHLFIKDAYLNGYPYMYLEKYEDYEHHENKSVYVCDSSGNYALYIDSMLSRKEFSKIVNLAKECGKKLGRIKSDYDRHLKMAGEEKEISI